MAGTKRGAYLMAAIERLVALGGEFQRISLFATVEPLPLVGAFVGGYEIARDGNEARFNPRRVELVRAAME